MESLPHAGPGPSPPLPVLVIRLLTSPLFLVLDCPGRHIRSLSTRGTALASSPPPPPWFRSNLLIHLHNALVYCPWLHREARKIPLNWEHRLMLGLAPDYDHLMVIQKVEVFEHALESTSGEDLHKVRRPGAAGRTFTR